MIVAFNASAYDALASGARTRTIGLAAALLRAGHAVRLFSPRGLSLRREMQFELGTPLAAADFEEIQTPLDPSSPVRRAALSRSWFERNVPRDADVFVTDYYPVLSRTPTLLTIHDLRYFAVPHAEPASRVAWFRAFYPRMARRAAGVVVPTEAVGSQAARFLGVEPARIAVVPNGLARCWRDAAPAVRRGEHLLMIGFAERRKNLATVLAALRLTRALPLVVAGRGRVPRRAADLVAAGRVRFVGAVDDDEIVRLARRAAALLHPSVYEGFGMTVIEAMSIGVPVLAAQGRAVEEVAGGFATLLPPGDAAAWAGALVGIDAPSPAARSHARSFAWSLAARSLLAAVRQ